MDFPKNIEDQKKLIINKDVNHVELIDYLINRIKLHDKNLNSFITLCEEKAYEEAKNADKLFAEFGQDIYQKYPLLGVSVSYKDLFLTKGVRTTAGSKVLANFISPYDSTVTERLKKAGTIMIGKTNCDAWAHGASGENSDFGPTKNPWNESCVPGGSSSGSAVSVSSDFALISTGTDTGGSIRQPANFCGVVGFKPTYGAVSRYGIISMSSSLDSIGHFSHTVTDSETIFNITKGTDGRDATVIDSEDLPTKEKYTLGIPKEYFSEGLDPEVKSEVERVIALFESNGFSISEISLPHTEYAISAYYIIQPAEVSSNLGRFDGVRYGYSRENFGAEAKRRIMLGTYVLSAGYYDQYYKKAMKVRSLISNEFDKAFEKVDAILAPVSPTLPFKLGEKVNDPVKMYLADIYTVAANISGIPGLAIPSNLSKEGLPMGFQLLGKKFSESILFDIGKKFETYNGIFQKKPDLG